MSHVCGWRHTNTVWFPPSACLQGVLAGVSVAVKDLFDVEGHWCVRDLHSFSYCILYASCLPAQSHMLFLTTIPVH